MKVKRGLPIGPRSTSAEASRAGPPPPPPPPPINLKYYGICTTRADGKKTAFFMDGDEILIEAEGVTFKGRYRLVRIGVNSAVVVDMQYKHEQTLPLAEDALGYRSNEPSERRAGRQIACPATKPGFALLLVFLMASIIAIISTWSCRAWLSRRSGKRTDAGGARRAIQARHRPVPAHE